MNAAVNPLAAALAALCAAGNAPAVARADAKPPQEKPRVTTPAPAAVPSDPDAAARVPVELTAGPVRCVLADGELRYLYVGETEIARRIYFAVRDGGWATALPRFTRYAVSRTADGFTVDLAADCRTDATDFSWSGRIEGKPDGTITFRANGAAGRPFRSNRIGLCVLYGSPAVTGRPFETVSPDGATVSRLVFPPHVSPQLVAPNFRTLRYESAGGLKVSTDVTGDARFDMEDQRTYSDSSFKAYAPLAYDYKAEIPAGKSLEQVVTLTVAGAGAKDKARWPEDRTVRVRVEPGTLPGAAMPKVVLAPPDAKPGLFGDVNGRAEKHRGASALAWGFDGTVHLPDADTLFENVLAVGDQVRTAHAYAPGAAVTLSPVLPARPGKWPARYDYAPLTNAWTAAVVHQAALAGVADVQPAAGPDRALLDDLAALAGRPLRAVTLSGPVPSPVVAFAAGINDGHGNVVLWLVNTTPRPQRASVEPLDVTVSVRRTGPTPGGVLAAETRTERPQTKDGTLTVDLAPYEVCRVETHRR